jgi:hypothetical protein
MAKSGPLTDLKNAIGKLATGRLKPNAGGDSSAGASDGASIAGPGDAKAIKDEKAVATKGTGRLRALAVAEGPKANKNASEARKNADAVWFSPVRDGAAAEGSGRKIERDAALVNESTKAANRKANAQIKANDALETAELGELKPAQRRQYKALAEAVKGDPQARLALQLLLIEGKLPGSKKSKDGKDLLGELAELESQKVVDGVSATELLGDMIQEIAVPSAIAQRSKGTCTVTSVQIIAADKDAAEYVRIVRGLASPKGEVRLRNGDKIKREPDTAKDDGTGRSISSRLWQPAMMEYGNGTDNYDNKTDKHTKSGRIGLNPMEVDRVLDAFSGGGAAYVEGIKDKDAKKHVDAMARAIKDGKEVLAGLEWGVADANGKIDNRHKVNVTKVTHDRVYYRNPWGIEESMSRADFEKRLNNYNTVKL